MILNEKDLNITIISKSGLSVDSLSFKRSVLTQKDIVAVDIIVEALKEFGEGNVGKEKYEMPLMF